MVSRGTTTSDGTITVAPSRPFWLVDQRLWLLLLAVTLADLIVIGLGPVIFLIEQDSTDQRRMTIATIIAVLLLPAQAVLLWKVLREITREHRRTRHLRRRIVHLLADRDLTIAFQPIVETASGRIVEAEALSRFPGTPAEPPDVWFAGAAEVGLGAELELMAVDKAQQAAQRLPARCRVGINVSPAILADPRLLAAVQAGPIDPRRVTVEVTEHTCINDYGQLRAVREQLRAAEIHLAVDDVGSGYASFRHIVALAPDVIKLDRTLVSGLDADKARRALIASMVMFALECGSVVLAEGVETAAELQCLAELGVDLVQGFLTGAPTVDPAAWQAWNEAVVPVKRVASQRLSSAPSGRASSLPAQRSARDAESPQLIRSTDRSRG